MPTETWNSDRRRNGPAAGSGVAASAKGRSSNVPTGFGAMRLTLMRAAAPSPRKLQKAGVRPLEGRPGCQSENPRTFERPSLGANRHDGRRAIGAGTACQPQVHRLQQRGPGGDREYQHAAGAGGQAGECRGNVAAAVVDEAVHGDHMVEGAEARVEHVAGRGIRCGLDVIRGCAGVRRRVASARARRHTSAPRRAASTASWPVPQPASRRRRPFNICGQADEQGGASGRVRRARWHGCGRRDASEVSRDPGFDRVRSK